MKFDKWPRGGCGIYENNACLMFLSRFIHEPSHKCQNRIHLLTGNPVVPPLLPPSPLSSRSTAPTRSSELHSDHIQRVLPPLSRPIVADDGGVGVVVVSVPSTSSPPTLLPDGRLSSRSRPNPEASIEYSGLYDFSVSQPLVHKNSLHVECTRDSRNI